MSQLSEIDLYTASIQELLDGLQNGRFTSVDLTRTYLARIEETKHMNAVLETNPNALIQAETKDRERSASSKPGGQPLGLLHGIPILVKDNVATKGGGMQTTAGSHALIGSIVPRDAFIVTQLLKEGAIILGKANLSEWSMFRGELASGWSGRGGQCWNAYLKGAEPSGSSSGSAVAAALGLAAGTIGTETDGSIVCPASMCNVVGMKPTVGLTSRTGVIPISENQDSVGPICRTVADCALMLDVIAGKDPRDPYTLTQPSRTQTYTSHLSLESLKGARLGVPRKVWAKDDWLTKGEWLGVVEAFDEALKKLTELGAVIFDEVDFPAITEFKFQETEQIVLDYEFKKCANEYLAELEEIPTGVKTVTDILKFNDEHPELEKPEHYQDQSRMVAANETTGYSDEKYINALRKSQQMGRELGIDHALREYKLDALVFPTCADTMRSFAAIAGYPIITVPLGFTPPNNPMGPAKPTIEYGPGLPFGLGLTSTAWTEGKLLGYAYALEQGWNVRKTFGGKERVVEGAMPRSGLGHAKS